MSEYPQTVRLWFDGIAFDLRQLYRSLTHAKGFSLAAAVTFALGVGVNLAVFAVLDRLLFRPLPYSHADQLVQVHLFAGGIDDRVSAAMMPHEVTTVLETEASSFQGLAFEAGWLDTSVPHPGENPIDLLPVSANSLSLLGVVPQLGRSFVEADAVPGAETAVLLTHEAWRARFGGLADVVSRSWQSGRRRYRVVGVLPPGFFFPSSRFVEHVDGLSAVRRTVFGQAHLTIAPVARLRPGITAAVAQAELDLLAQRHAWIASPLRRSAAAGRLKLFVQPLRNGMTMIVGPYLWLTSSVVWIVLAIACVNLSALLLMRGQSRKHAAAVRAAVGASPARIVRLGVLEAVAICAAGASIAWLTYLWLQNWILAIVPPTLRGFATAPWDGRIILVTVATTSLCAAMAAIVPAFAARRVDLLTVLRAERSRGSRRSVFFGGKVLLAIEAAFGVVVTVGAAAIVPQFAGFLLKPTGFQERDVFTVTVNHDWRDAGEYPARVERLRTILEVVQTLPRLERAAVAFPPPFGTPAATSDFWKQHGLAGRQFAIGPGIFQVLKVPIRAGREFLPEEIAGPVAMVNESAARALWPAEPVATIPGRYIQTSAGSRLVVGVARDIRSRPSAPSMPDLFLPIGAAELEITQSAIPVVIRMRPGAIPDAGLLTARLNERFPANGIRVVSAAEQLAPVMDRPRFLATLFGAVATVALVLVAVGVYGVASVECARRRHDMGICLALGASARRVRLNMLVQILVPVVLGAAAGLLASALAIGSLRASIREFAASNALVYAAGAALIVAAAAGATWWSTRRIACIDPAHVFRASAP